MADSRRQYKLREIVFEGKTKYIILQNQSEWSGAVEIVNLLLLHEELHEGMKIKKKPHGEKYVDLTMIHSVIDNHTRMLLQRCVESNLLTEDAASSFLPSLEYALCQPSSQNFNMHPLSFKRIGDFEETHEHCVLTALRVDTFHGWLIDPKDSDMSNAVGTKSCKELIQEHKDFKASKSKSGVHRMSLIQRFLDKSRDQLTSYGLACLHENVPEGRLSLLFREDRLSVMYKRNGTLYVLVTSHDVVENHPDAIWRKMEKVEEHGDYVTGTFDPVEEIWLEIQDNLLKEEAEDKKKKQISLNTKPKQKGKKRLMAQGQSGESNAGLSEDTKDNTHEAKVPAVTGTFDPVEEIWLEIQDNLLKEEAEDKKKKQISLNTKPKQKGKKRLMAQGQSGESNAGLSEDTKDNTHEAKVPAPLTEVARLRNSFMKFLEECTHDGKSYFKGQIESMLLTGSIHLMFCHHLIRTYDKELAVSVSNNYYRAAEDLRECFCDYFLKIQEESVIIQEKLKSCIMDQREVLTKIKLTICCISQKKRVLSFEEFVGAHILYTVYEFDGISENSTSYIGRMLALGYLCFILQTHKEGLSWNGVFDESLMSVKIKKGIMKFKIKKTACMVGLKRESGINDIDRYQKIIFPRFKSPDVEGYPAYFDQFVLDFMAMPDPDASPGDYKKFRKYMKSHLFAKAPLVRSSLISNTYRACDSLVVPRPRPGSWSIYDKLEVQDKGLLDWDSTGFSAPMLKVHNHKASSSNKFDNHTYWTALMLGRHAVEHLHWFTQETNVQTVKDLVIIDLRIARDLKGAIARVIRFIIMKRYKSDDLTLEKPIKDDALDGDTKTGTGATVAIPSLGSATTTSSASGPPIVPAAKVPFLQLECEMLDQVVGLSCKDLESLKDKRYLFDSVIDFMLARISLTFINHSDILLLRTNFAFLIERLGAEEGKDAVQALTQHHDLESRRLVFVPVNDTTSIRLDKKRDEGNHWSLLVIYIAEDRSSCRFVHHDSAGGFNTLAANRYARALKHVLPKASPESVVQAETPGQLDGFNCGLCVITLTNEICKWWNKKGRSGKSKCWFETLKSKVKGSTYADMRLQVRDYLERLALATATVAALDVSAGIGVAPALGTATPLPALKLKYEGQNKVVELSYKDLGCLAENGTYVIDDVIEFVYTRLSLVYQSQDLLLMWPHVFLMWENMKADEKVKVNSLLGSCRILLLPICENKDSMQAERGSHWSLLVVQISMDRSSCRFVHHDLVGLNQNVAIQYAEVLQQLLPVAPPVVEVPIPEQTMPMWKGDAVPYD